MSSILWPWVLLPGILPVQVLGQLAIRCSVGALCCYSRCCSHGRAKYGERSQGYRTTKQTKPRYAQGRRNIRARGVVGYHARLAISLREGSGSIPDVSIFFNTVGRQPRAAQLSSPLLSLSSFPPTFDTFYDVSLITLANPLRPPFICQIYHVHEDQCRRIYTCRPRHARSG